MAIIFHTEDIIFRFSNKKIIRSWINRVSTRHYKEVGDINYIFCSDAKILEINKQFLNHDYYTDIISFDYSEINIISGDIYISIDTVKSNALKFGVLFKEELHRVIIHGVLHFLGYKDKTKADSENMRRLENESLQILNTLL
ncbi:MAG: rRNA maturation RNase YbeY [Bacteroidota bacterium]